MPTNNVFAYTLISTSGIGGDTTIAYSASGNNTTSGDAVVVVFPESWSVQRAKATSENGSVADRLASQYGWTKILAFELTCNVVYTLEIYNNQTTTVNGTVVIEVDELVDPSCGSGGSGENEGGGDCGCIFNTPGWSDYMGKIDDIIAAIPPAPNWSEVADTFGDAIVPRLIADVGNMLGMAPALPNPPPPPIGLDDGNLQKPTGQDSGLDGFDESDIKSGTPIDFNEDPTGGWDLLDPLENMPEQETFIPNMGDLNAPVVPDVEGEAPTPTEPPNPIPSNPSDPENIAPTPSETGGTAPTPSEPSNPAPSPSEPSNPAPMPGENGNPFPMPGNGSNIAPIPGGNSGNAPVPEGNGGNAPVPNW